jgi:hypothetical protein
MIHTIFLWIDTELPTTYEMIIEELINSLTNCYFYIKYWNIYIT